MVFAKLSPQTLLDMIYIGSVSELTLLLHYLHLCYVYIMLACQINLFGQQTITPVLSKHPVCAPANMNINLYHVDINRTQ